MLHYIFEHFLGLSLHGSWDALIVCKILSQSLLRNSTSGKADRNYIGKSNNITAAWAVDREFVYIVGPAGRVGSGSRVGSGKAF